MAIRRDALHRRGALLFGLRPPVDPAGCDQRRCMRFQQPMRLTFAHGSLAALVLVSLACAPARRDDGDDDSCARPCRNACCAAGESCHPDTLTCQVCAKTTCAEAGAECSSLDDGCGGTLTCASCVTGLTCGGGGVANRCGAGVCVKATCDSLGAQCGRAGDGCGGVLDCGRCAGTLTCGVPSANTCGSGSCVAENDLSMCERFGKDCGPVLEFDNCGNSRPIPSCGRCAESLRCGENGVCGCPAESDEELCAAEETCGARTLRDRCGVTRSVVCGPCASYSHPCGRDPFECTGDSRCFQFSGEIGICTRICSPTEPCQAGGVCVDLRPRSAIAVCGQPCTSGSQCASGQSCFNGGCFPSEASSP